MYSFVLICDQKNFAGTLSNFLIFSFDKIQAVYENEMMNIINGKTYPIVLDDDLVKKLRDKQSKLIKESAKSVSFSSVINQTLRKGIK